jgi:ubiquinone/menaquinone biosynthesis C-methylase UbiE
VTEHKTEAARVVSEHKTEAARVHFDRWAPTYERDRAARRLREAGGTVQRAVGFDLSAGMIAEARTRADGLRNVDFVVGDASDRLPFADTEFTAAFCSTAFHHFPDQLRTIAEMARVLAPGARRAVRGG